jgi:phosphoglycerate kinase
MLRSIRDVDVMHKLVLVRLDLDVPVSSSLEGSVVGDRTRLHAALPTLQYLLSHQAQVVILGHMGRPDGEIVDGLSLKPVLSALMEMLDYEYTYQIIDERPHLRHEGTIYALENLRFHAGEEQNDVAFAQWLASFGEMYVNDAFAVSHRAHASLEAITRFVPSFAGIHLLEEVSALQGVMKDPARPLTVVLGGAKVETKLPVIDHLSGIADSILLGGKLLAEADPRTLPKNVILGKLTADGFDLDQASQEHFASLIADAGTVVWNGPVGKFEDEASAVGTRSVAEAIAANTGARRLVGGGDTLEALHRFGLTQKVGYVSSGGGAMLDFLAGEELPALKALGLYDE